MAKSPLIRQDLSKELVRGKQAAFRYDAIDNQNLAWSARQENQRRYAEGQARKAEQEKLRDDLLKVQSLGLPKELQGSLNHEVESLVERVRKGELDPDSYDFRAGISNINGKATQYDNFIAQAKSGMSAVDNSVVEFDENGVPVDKKRDIDGTFLEMYEKDYDPEGDLDDRMQFTMEGYGKARPSMEINDESMSQLTDEFIERNASKYADIERYKKNGLSGYNLLTEVAKVNPEVAQAYNEHVKKNTYAARVGQTAKVGSLLGNNSDMWGDNEAEYMISPYLLPEDGVIREEQETELDKFALEGMRHRNDMKEIAARKKKPKKPIEFGTRVIPANDGKLNESNQFQEYPAFVHGTFDVMGKSVAGVVKTSEGEKAILVTPAQGNEPSTTDYVDDSTLVQAYKTEALKETNTPIREGVQKSLSDYDNTDVNIIDVDKEVKEIEGLFDKFKSEGMFTRGKIYSGDREEDMKSALEGKGYELKNKDGETLNLEDVDFTNDEETREFIEELAVSNKKAITKKDDKVEETIEGFSKAQIKDAAQASGMTVEEYIKRYNESNK